MTHEAREYKLYGGDFAQGKLTGELTVIVDDGVETKIVFSSSDDEDEVLCAKAETPPIPDVPVLVDQ